MAFYTHSGRVVVEEIVPDRVNLLAFLREEGIAFEFSLPPAASLNEKKRYETERALDLFSDDVRNVLKFAFSKGVKGSVISHPKKDGTTTRGAAEALSVEPANVLKTLIWETGSELIATICSGVKHVDKQRLREVTGADHLQLARPARVMAATAHVPGAVPTIGLFKFKLDGIIKEVYVSEEVMGLDYVNGSAGSVFLGFKFAPPELTRLGALVVPIARKDSLLFMNESEINELIKIISEAVAHDDDRSVVEAARAVGRLGRLFLEGGIDLDL
jgi:prolyl-tRNA editing enzyme YbaK/EbsC (Cys-tRNA(Pro) deacylase)